MTRLLRQTAPVVVSNAPRSIRGFAVLAVMVVGVVAIALSMTLLTAFGTTARANQTSDVVRRTDAAADAALTKTAAWLDEVRAADGDLDRALSGRSGCDGSDATAFVMPIGSGKREIGGAVYSRLSFNGVTAWVRVVDNRDDGALGGAQSRGACAEGEDLVKGQENLAKDRDGQVWILVIAEADDENTRTNFPARRVVRGHYDNGALLSRDLAPQWQPVVVPAP